jgi:hypothetical protein
LAEYLPAHRAKSACVAAPSARAFFALLLGQGVNSETGPHVGYREVITFKQQGRVHGRGERVGGAIREIEPRLGVNAFAIAVER